MALRDHGLGGLLPHDKIKRSEQKELSTLTNEGMLEVMQQNIATEFRTFQPFLARFNTKNSFILAKFWASTSKLHMITIMRISPC